MEEFTIFTESNEDMGLLFDGYKGIGEQVKSFLGVIEGKISELLKDPQHANADLREEITKFKAAVDKKPTPKPINISKVGSTKAMVKNYRSEMEKVLDRYAKARDKMSFGGNLMRSIIMKPKVYSKEIDSESYAKNNRNIRNIERALDWVEKVLIDLFNLIDQDLNILTLVGKVYGKRKIYEHTEIFQSGDFDAYNGYANIENQKDDLLDEPISSPEVHMENLFHNETFSESDNNDIIKRILEFHTFMSKFKYGLAIDGIIDLKRSTKFDDYDKLYHVASPHDFEKQEGGICWDFVTYQADYFNRHFKGIQYTTWYIEFNAPPDYPTHTFMIIRHGDKYIYFESAFGRDKKYKQIWVAKSEEDIINFVMDNMNNHPSPHKGELIKLGYYVTRYNALDKRIPGSTSEEFMNLMRKYKDKTNHRFSKSYNVSKLGLREFTEAADDPPPNMPTEGDKNNGEGKEQSERDREVSQTSDVPGEDAEVHDEPEESEADQPKEEVKESMPKKTDQVESSKNGVRRKKLYVAFIEWAKEYNSKNTFGSIFDKDIFHNVYPFVPEEMRYFYRLANPILCVLSGDLTFFQVSELKKLNAENKGMDKLLIFAATPNDLRVFNKEDKRIYLATEADGKIILGESIGDTFDLYIQKMIKKGDILNGPLDSEPE